MNASTAIPIIVAVLPKNVKYHNGRTATTHHTTITKIIAPILAGVKRISVFRHGSCKVLFPRKHPKIPEGGEPEAPDRDENGSVPVSWTL